MSLTFPAAPAITLQPGRTTTAVLAALRHYGDEAVSTSFSRLDDATALGPVLHDGLLH